MDVAGFTAASRFSKRALDQAGLSCRFRFAWSIGPGRRHRENIAYAAPLRHRPRARNLLSMRQGQSRRSPPRRCVARPTCRFSCHLLAPFGSGCPAPARCRRSLGEPERDIANGSPRQRDPQTREAW